jgi:amino acid adenylation domain-containing protein
VGGQETTTNLIGNGLLTLLRHPDEFHKLRNDLSLIPSAVEEMLRYESPSQHTARMCPSDREVGGKLIKKRQAVIAIMAAANRDPERFPDPDRFDITRKDNRHLAFGYAAHYCFGAPLARVEGQVVFEALLRRFSQITLEEQSIEWRSNLGLRGLTSLKIKVKAEAGLLEAARPGDAIQVTPRRSSVQPGPANALSANSGCPHQASIPVIASHAPDKDQEKQSDKQDLIRKYLQSRNMHKVEEVPEIPISSAPHAPLSFAQEQIWLHGQFAKDLYNESFTVCRRGPLDAATLRRSLTELIRRHQAWRTTFKVIHDQPVQIVQPPFEPDMVEIDLRELPENQRESEALRLGRERARQSYDMERGPLLRAMLIRLGEEDYRFYLFLHHIIFDGFSIYRVFLPELVTIYNAFLAGQSSPLPELRLQYSDFAQWQRESLDSAKLNESRAYWSKQLDGELPVLELPTDRPRPAIQSFRGATHRFAFSKELSQKLHQLARQENTSFFTTILACFAALLRRYSAQQDFILGTVTSGRKRSSLEALLGCFQNPLALRIKLEGDRSFRELLAHAREVTLEALSHDDAPFERLVEELSVRRDTSRNPLFPVMFSLVPPTSAFEPGWDLNQLDLDIGTAKFDLDLELDDRPEALLGRFVYSTDLFDAPTIARMTGHFETILEAIVADPDQKLSRLPLLTAAEKEQLRQWNNTETEFPRDRCVHQLVEAQVARTPRALAVEHGDQELTYRALNERANQLASLLRKRGVGAESRVGICLRRSLELPVALLAVLKAGGACVPLDPAYPKERLAYMLEDSQASLVLTQPGLLAEVTDLDAEVITLEADWHTLSSESGENVRSQVSPDNLAYVIYTSGSTGKPRGVLLTHLGLVNHNTAAAKLFNLSATDRMAQFASISFDIAVEEIFPTWISGGALVVREEDASLAVGDFLRWVTEKRVTALDLPTAYWHELVGELSESSMGLPESLRIVIVGGEKASLSALSAWHKLAGSRVRWVNTYGPTETSVIVTAFEPGDKDWEKISPTLPIGRPIANTKIHILDENLQPLPIGIAGDLFVEGPGLARGYLNRPEVTAEKFIRNPFRSDSESRIYKTGDRARYLTSGEIEFAGRTDDQVKIRGYRVELKEIEAILGAHPGVREIAVVVRENATEKGPVDKHLVAYVVPSREQTPTGSELRAYLKQKLPPYMVPSAFVLLEAMPKTPNGKVDKRGMPAPTGADFAEAHEYVAPSDDLEKNLVKLWGAVLGKDRVGIRDNFFDLGGHSLLAARLMHRVEQTLGQRLPLAALLQAPTVEQFAALLRQEGWSASWSSLVPIQAEGSKTPFFCVHGVGGNVLGFRDLARHLEPDQPFYALQPQGLDGKRPCLTRVPEMAERYIREIKRIQPQGPYRIGGYSFGGLVAYEMAQRLHAINEEVSLLALFDTYPGKMESRASQLRNLRKLPLQQQIGFLLKKGSFVLMTLRKRLELQMLPRPLRNVREACAQAAGAYDVEPYHGQVTLFRVKEKSVGSLDDPYAIWWRVAAGGVDLREISGDHLSLLKEPQVRLLAEQLSDALNHAAKEDSLIAAGSY